MKDYASNIPEECREEYNELVSKVFGEVSGVMQEAVMKIVGMIVVKYICLLDIV